MGPHIHRPCSRGAWGNLPGYRPVRQARNKAGTEGNCQTNQTSGKPIVRQIGQIRQVRQSPACPACSSGSPLPRLGRPFWAGKANAARPRGELVAKCKQSRRGSIDIEPLDIKWLSVKISYVLYAARLNAEQAGNIGLVKSRIVSACNTNSTNGEQTANK